MGKSSEIKQNESSLNHIRHQTCILNLSPEATCVKQPNKKNNSITESHSGEQRVQENK